jgi:hypothetical protein
MSINLKKKRLKTKDKSKKSRNEITNRPKGTRRGQIPQSGNKSIIPEVLY